MVPGSGESQQEYSKSGLKRCACGGTASFLGSERKFWILPGFCDTIVRKR